MKTKRARLAVLAALLGLGLGTSYSQKPNSPQVSEEVSRQESIYHSKGEQRPRGYTIDRSLVDYAHALPAEFDRTLANLGPADRWLDIGAGEGKAILDYYTADYDQTHQEGRERRGRKAKAVAISIEDRRTPEWRQKAESLEPDQIQYFFNKRLREYSREELGPFQLITDVIGGFSYTENLAVFMEKVLSLLELNGSFYTVLQDVHAEAGTNLPYYRNAGYFTEIVNANGDEVRVCSWLKSTTCVKVTCEFREGWIPPIEVFHVQKVCNDTAVQPLLTVQYAAGTPPERRFRLERAAAAASR